MKTEEMICELRRLEEAHKDDFVGTCETNWSLMCRDVANRLEELLAAQEPRDMISRVAVIERMKSMAGCATCNNYNGVRCRACIWDDAMNIVEEMSTVNAIPVEWLKIQESSYTGDVSDIGKSVQNGTIKNLIRKWQKEQEG